MNNTSGIPVNPFGMLPPYWRSSIIFPGLPTSFKVPLSTNAASDLFATKGKNGQFIDVVPGRNIVVIGMGEAPDNSLVPITFHDDMWEKINSIINQKHYIVSSY